MARLVRETSFQRSGLFAPAVLGVAAAVAFGTSVLRGSPALRILAGLLAGAAAFVLVMGEIARSSRDPRRRSGTAIGVLLTAVFAAQPFTPSVAAFLERAFGARALGVPVTVVAAAATAALLGPPLVLAGPALLALTDAAARESGLGARVRLVLWLAGLAEVPERLRADRDRARLALAWIAAVFAGWIAYTAWRGI